MSVADSRGRPLRALIDTAAFSHNIALAQTLCPQSEVLVVIKADAYGHGLLQLAKAAGDRQLAVATSNEAEILIRAGVRNTIWVLEGPFDRRCMALQREAASLIWVVHCPQQLALIKQHVADGSDACIWLKVDTGMHRLGFVPEWVPEALSIIEASETLQLQGVMTHFASSEVVGDPSVEHQIKTFDRVLEDNGLIGLPQSLCNSAAILHCPEARRAWVRPGISLYGGFSCDAAPYKAVMTLESAVIALRKVAQGESVGYGGIWTAKRPSLIATVACGYGDGYPRHAPSGTPVLVNGLRATLAGRVSMDMITVDVTDVPGVALGSRVELWGQELNIDEVADHADTISYELLTQVTARVPRNYKSVSVT